MSEVKEVRIEQVVEYVRHTLRANGNLDLTFKAQYSELTNSVQLIQMLNNDVFIKAKLPNKKAMALGMFRIKDIKVNDDGESQIKFNSLNTYVEMDNINLLILDDDGVKQFRVLYDAEIELED